MTPTANCRLKLLSSLAKVFPDEEPVYRPECLKLSGLWGETISFQAAYSGAGLINETLTVEILSPLSPRITVRSVEPVPVRRAVNEFTDDNYLRTVPGLYPDLLRPLPEGNFIPCSRQWRSLWIDIDLDSSIPAGEYSITIQLKKDGDSLCEGVMKTTVIGAFLPELPILHTEWMHADCLADYYQVEVFSQEHWEILENFFREYGKRNGNMMLVPLFTPPLDTAPGMERTTVQLIDVTVQNGEYSFGFDKLKRWIDLCRSCGITHFEMSHLFTQWGAEYAPKIVATVNGRQEKIFGWHTPAVGEYTVFLHSFLPRLTEKLREWGIADAVCFHLSDEPGEEKQESYRAAKESLGNLLKGFRIFDALSSYELYRQGLVENPVIATSAIEPFLSHGLTGLWTYYCTAQFYQVSNRFMSMPSARNRIYGVQLYKYRIAGILHWGYNFYNSEYSLEHINPYQVTDAGNAFPAGDPFLVYPGPDRHPQESIRMMVHDEGMADLRALTFLETLTSREHVMDLIEGNLAEPLTFRTYPKSDMYLLTLRNQVNREISKLISGN